MALQQMRVVTPGICLLPLALWPCSLFPSLAGHQWMASSLPGWMGPPSPQGDSLANAQGPPECPRLPFLHLPARLQLLQLQGQGSIGFTKKGQSCAPGPSGWGTFSQPRPPDQARQLPVTWERFHHSSVTYLASHTSALEGFLWT